MEIFSNIDVARWATPARDALLVTGWAFPATTGAGAWEGFRLRCGDRIHGGYYGMHRPDVHQAHPGSPAALFSGFSFLIQASEKDFPCSLEAVDAGGRVLLVRALPLDGVGVPPAQPPTGPEPAPGLGDATRTPSLAGVGSHGKPVLFIGHDFAYAGAQIILLRFLRWLRSRGALPFEILLNVPRATARHASPPERLVLDGYGELGPVHFLSDLTGAPENLTLIRSDHYGLVYANTSTLGVLLAAMQPCPAPVISHVYEMGFWIERRTGRAVFDRQAAHTDRFIACSQAVRGVLTARLGVPAGKIDVIHACASTERARLAAKQHTRDRVRLDLGLPADAFVVQACGTFDWRKGADLFVPLCIALRRRLAGRDFRALWIGDHGPPVVKDQFEHEVDAAGLTGKVQLLPPQDDLPRWMLAADCFALTSREDPFPMVMLEAGALGLPVVGFDGSGGITEYAAAGAGLVVPYLDLEALADALARLAREPHLAAALGATGRAQVEKKYDQEISFQRALDLILACRSGSR